VAYKNETYCTDNDLISSSSTNVQMRVDSSNVTPNGRPSVRITSNQSYNPGTLVILDLEHMPGGICGTWPAFWMVGPNWPNDGEIDIIEGVNQQTSNDMTLHTSEGCTMSSSGDFTGSVVSTDCWIDDPDQSDNEGCQITTSNTETYGTGFNANNGGVYATNFQDSAISIYFFARGSIPSDITDGSPDPSGWGTPIAQFTDSSCDIESYFTDLQIVFDTTFCGQWAGNVWSSGSCASVASTCDDYVENNPAAFADAYWSINTLQVYSGTSNGLMQNNTSNSSWDSSASASVALPSSVPATVGSSVPAASSTTFAVSTKSAPFPAGNSTSVAESTGASSNSAWAAAVTGTGPIGEIQEPGVSATSAAPSSPAEVTPAFSSAGTQSWDWQSHTLGWHDHHEPSAAALKRHMKHHKRHGAGRL